MDPATQSWREAIVSIKSWLRSSEQSREALHEASASRHAEQDGPVHLFPGRKLWEAVGDAVRRDHHRDGSLVRVAVIFFWRAVGMPEDGC
jgi:hypothetical protein